MSMSRFVGSVSLGLISALVVSACSDEAETPDDFAVEYCRLLSPCCVEAGFSSDTAQCEQITTYTLLGSSYDEAKGEVCLSAMRAERSNEDYCKTADRLEPCEKVFASRSGSVAPGGACGVSSDCANTADGEGMCMSTSTDPEDANTCMIVAVGSGGEKPCVGDKVNGEKAVLASPPLPTLGYVCDQSKGVYCDTESETCVPMKKVGETCDYNDTCVPEARCDSYTCIALGSIGESCFGNSDCVEGAYCDDDGKCAQKLPTGSPCTFDECEGTCVESKCEPALGFAYLCTGA